MWEDDASDASGDEGKVSAGGKLDAGAAVRVHSASAAHRSGPPSRQHTQELGKPLTSRASAGGNILPVSRSLPACR